MAEPHVVLDERVVTLLVPRGTAPGELETARRVLRRALASVGDTVRLAVPAADVIVE